jgi:hypothetical protein
MTVLSAIAAAGSITGANTIIGVQGGTTDVQYTWANGAAYTYSLMSGDATAAGGGAITLATVNSGPGSVGSSTAIPVLTTNAKGLVTAQSTAAVIAPAGTLTGTTLASNVVTTSITSTGTLTGGATGAGFTVALSTSTIAGTIPSANLPTASTTVLGAVKVDGSTITITSGVISSTGGGGGITTLTGDVTAGPGSGSQAATLATVNSNTGTWGSATQVAQVTVNGKGLTTAAANVTITPAWSSITSTPTTLAGYGITSPLNVAQGGTAAATLTAHAVLLGEGTSALGTATIGTQYNVLTDNGAVTDPTFNTLTSVIDGAFTGTAQGNILYRDSAVWKVLAPGTSGYLLQTNGASANPSWVVAPSGGGTKTYSGTTDPGVSTDNTLGYAASSLGINTNTGRSFVCRNAATGAAVWDLIQPADHPGYVGASATQWYPTEFYGTAGPNSAGTLGVIYACMFFVKERLTISALGASVTTLSASGNFQLAIYSNGINASNVNRPNVALATSASGSTSATGFISVAITPSTLQLEPGIPYWICRNCDNSTARFTGLVSSSLMFVGRTGTPTVADIFLLNALSFATAFNTWTSPLVSSAWSEVAGSLASVLAAYEVASVP